MTEQIPLEELLKEVQRLAEELSRPPTSAEMSDFGQYGTSTYYERFESWDDVLTAAEVGTVGPEQRKKINQRLSDEELLTEIGRLAEELGRPPSAAEMNKMGNHSPGAYQDRFGSWSAAIDAAGFESRSEYGELATAELLGEIERLAEKMGHTPTATEMREDGRYSVAVYQNRFGSWADALDAASLSPRQANTPIPEEDLLAELQRLADGDDPPTISEMDENGEYSTTTYRRRFESWTDACQAAELIPRRSTTPIPEEDLIAELHRLADGDEPPTVVQMNEEGAYSYPTYTDRFGSWAEACRAAGLTPRFKGRVISDEDLLAELQQMADGDVPPTIAQMNAEGAYSQSTYTYRFGSWAEACEAAGLSPPDSNETISKEELLSELRRLADGNQPPTTTEMNEEGQYSSATFYRHFESWTEACKAAGLPPR